MLLIYFFRFILIVSTRLYDSLWLSVGLSVCLSPLAFSAITAGLGITAHVHILGLACLITAPAVYPALFH